MFTRANDVLGAHLAAADGPIGIVEDVVYEDSSWIIRYLTVETGTWLPSRKVLISPVAVKSVHIPGRVVTTILNIDQVRNAPSVNVHPTLDRQHELAVVEYFDWPRYWEESISRDWLPSVSIFNGKKPPHVKVENGRRVLCSFRELYGYRLQAMDGRIGYVDDLIFRSEDWLIRYIVVDTRELLPSRRVLVAPQWVTKCDWDHKRLSVSLTRDEIRHGPPYNRESLQNLQLEAMAMGQGK